MSDKRSVSTDALETLGTIIGPNEKRDAIHLAVEPVEAGESLWHGASVVIRFGRAYRCRDAEERMGIVDPFLKGEVQAGQRFWFVMNPRQVRSLRHVWSHPDFPDEGAAPTPLTSAEESEKWLRDFCASHDAPDYDSVVKAATGQSLGDECSAEMEDDYWLFTGIDGHCDIPAVFWDHLERVTGRKFPHRPAHFSCSC